MKTYRIILLLLVGLLSLQQCGPKEKNEAISSPIDSILVEEKTIDTVATEIESKEEIIPTKEIEVVKKEEVKTTEPKASENVKNHTKQEVKKTVETKVEEVVKKEVTPEKVIEKVEEIKKEVVVIQEAPKVVVAASGWVVPEKDKNLKNPTPFNKENSAIGKEIYALQCKACHGTKGLGDGPKAKSMKGDLGDFSSASFQAQTDGELFYKTKFGRADMPSYAKRLSDEDIWLVVHFMRTLKK